MDKKQALYYLLRKYNKKEYDIKTFCDVFDQRYFDIDEKNNLSTYEDKILRDLAMKCSRFWPNEEDNKKYPSHVYFGTKEMDKFIKECCEKLNIE